MKGKVELIMVALVVTTLALPATGAVHAKLETYEIDVQRPTPDIPDRDLPLLGGGMGFRIGYGPGHDHAVADFTLRGTYVGTFLYTDVDGTDLDSDATQAFTGEIAMHRVLPADQGLATFLFRGAQDAESAFSAAGVAGAAPSTLFDATFAGKLVGPEPTKYLRYGFFVPSDVDAVKIRLSHDGIAPLKATVHDARGTPVAVLEPDSEAGYTDVTVPAPGGVWQLAIHGGFTGTLRATVRQA